ncbi:calcium-translocating P-type ATPase, PMCA-type [Anaeromassilibacillus senegalensis]|uniref:P-type Ca(2+) transporter n=2 Tax=Anaeromassilibacillus senegalensis TaxID=1673717 RepID=A0ABS9CLQ8_9FIRM|nr:calcium-translocating P-type ATPase, PMCA-type [Anaeromassilibacillus senegalensis]
MEFFANTAEQVLSALHADREHGLTAAEAEKRLQEYGANVLKEKKKKTNLQRFLDQFKDVMILILVAAAIVSFVIAWIEGDAKAFFEPCLILLIVILNAIMGVLQESKAERALDALKGLSAPHARVLRDGQEQIVDAASLVPGDIIRLEAGDFVPADARLLQSAGLKSEESALTGESVPAEKDALQAVPADAALGDRANMVFSGCSITYGTAAAVVTATGMQTEMGKIAGLLSGEADTQTPLQKKLAALGKNLGFLALAACAIIFVVGLLNGIPVMEIFMTSVSLAVSAIPEGLPAIVTIVLSIGVQRMVKKNAIIRRLPAVETLGSASVICSDKTGTLTQNRMTLQKAYLNGAADAIESGSEDARALIRMASLCCDGTVTFNADGTATHIGDPTETAIVYAAHQFGDTKENLNAAFPRIAELPFDSDRKRMSVVVETEGRQIVITKGAFDGIAPLCSAGDTERGRVVNDAMSREALRVLAIGVREIDALPQPLTPENLETDLTFLGLLGMIDPPRDEARDAVAVCREAGIRPVMITGDHVVTASAIAKSLGILQEGDLAITGAQLDAMSDAELDDTVEKVSVYARVSPENKIRIVKAWQKKDQVVAMTGDGVNDAPALKAADIGCAMGITGTDVAKGAADMTLTDDNFATIVDAVREGRGIYANIKKVVGFLLGTNIGEVITVFAAMLIWHKSPLLSMQLLWINLVTDSLPAIALGMEGVEDGVMRQKPKPKNEGIFAHGLGVRVVLQGVMFALLSLAAFQLGWQLTGELAGGQTLAFMTLSLSQIVQAFNMRSDRSLFKIGFFTNRKLNMACLASVALVALVLFTPLSIPFGLMTLASQLYLIGLALSLVPLFVMELSKAFGLIKHQK